MNVRPTPARTAKEAAEQALDAKEEIERQMDGLLEEAETRTRDYVDNWLQRIEGEFDRSVQESRNIALGHLNQLSAQIDETVQQQQAVLHELSAERNEQYARDEASANELLERLRGILGTATGETLSSKHHETANYLRSQADKWARGTLVLWVGAIVLGVAFTLWQLISPPEVASIYELLPRLLNVSPIAVIVAAAQFASRQSQGHRRAERSIEHTALQLDAAEPFVTAIGISSKIQVIRSEDLGNLPEALREHIELVNEAERKRLDVRLRLVDKLFLGTEPADD